MGSVIIGAVVGAVWTILLVYYGECRKKKEILRNIRGYKPLSRKTIGYDGKYLFKTEEEYIIHVQSVEDNKTNIMNLIINDC